MDVRTFGTWKVGQVTRESNSGLLLLSRAWGQKPQFAVHFPGLWVIKYAVVGFASNLPSMSPRMMAVPTETRICSGKSVGMGVFSCNQGA